MSSPAIATTPPGDSLDIAFGKINDAFDATTREILMGVAVGWNTTFPGGVVERIAISTPEPVTLGQVRAGAVAEACSEAKRRLDAAFFARYSEGERYLWPELERDARAVVAGESLEPDSVLAAEAAAVGAELSAYAAGIVANADQLRAFRAEIVAARARAQGGDIRAADGRGGRGV